MFVFSRSAWVLPIVLLLACSSHTEERLPLIDVRLVPVGTIFGGESATEKPVLELPAYLHSGPGARLWTLDTSRRSAIEFDSAGHSTTSVGRKGHGPGEVWVALAFDVARDGTVWIADPGNAKILAFRNGRLQREFLVDHQPLGIVAVDDGTIWVGGDLMNTTLIRYDRWGRRMGTAGVPARRGMKQFRLNQGVVTRGSGVCAAVWAYTFHSLIDCYSHAGGTRWRVRGPVEVEPSRRADPWRMLPSDRFAYVDVTAHGGRIYGLFVGGPGRDDGLRTREVHVFAERDGKFLGRMVLPQPAKYITVNNNSLATLDYDPSPLVRLYALQKEQRDARE